MTGEPSPVILPGAVPPSAAARRCDDLLAWELGPDTVWRRVTTSVGIGTQQATLQERARRRSQRPTLRT